MKITFHIHPDAAAFIRKNELRPKDGKEMVMQLYAFHRLPSELTRHITSIEEATKFAEANMTSVPQGTVFRWAVGSNFRDSLPASDIHLVDGIPFHVPEKINRIIGNRELVLDNGKLRFEPDFEPFSHLPIDEA